MTTATMTTATQTTATKATRWTACPTCGGHGLRADARFDAPTAVRLCPTCEGLGNVRKS